MLVDLVEVVRVAMERSGPSALETRDCAESRLSPELLRQAAQQALRRGMLTRSELSDVETALEPLGGLAE